jgi:Tfp pilus assembly protein PilF
MAKPMLVTLPLVMLLLDFWPLGRYRQEEPEPGLRRLLALIKEKVPFLACSLLSGIVTIYAQQKGGAIVSVTAIPLVSRIENALIAYVKYIILTLWPHDLAVSYPFPVDIPFWQVIGSALVLLFISAAVIRLGRRYPYLPVGWFWFLITLVPVIGLIKVGAQAMADRYAYLPSIGLFMMAAWGVPDLAQRWRHRRGILALLAFVAVIASAAATWRQLGYWQDSVSLFRHTLQVNDYNWVIHYNLGFTFESKGDFDGAITEYQAALLINPYYKQTHTRLGLAYVRKGDPDAAIREYQEALQIDPAYKEAHNNLGLALTRTGNLDAAIREYREALQIDPAYKEAHNNLGVAFGKKGNMDAAIREFNEALRIDPNDKEAHNNLGRALAGLKRTPNETGKLR